MWSDGLTADQRTYENHSDDCEHQQGDVLLLVVLALFHGLPRLDNGDLLLLQRDEVVQLVFNIP